METKKAYRLADNPKEKELHDKFKKEFERDNLKLSAIVFGWGNNNQSYPKDWLSEREEDICLSLIQWLGSHVGQSFLDSCGFTLKDNK